MPNVSPPPPALSGNAEQAHMRELSRLRAAALRARRVYPGELGELVSRELTAFAEFGLRFASDALVPRLADVVLEAPLPAERDVGTAL